MPAYIGNYMFEESFTGTVEYAPVNLTKTYTFYSNTWTDEPKRIYSMEIRPKFFADIVDCVVSIYAGSAVAENKKIGSANMVYSTAYPKGIEVSLVNGYENIIKNETQLTVNVTGTMRSIMYDPPCTHYLKFDIYYCVSNTETSRLRHYSTTFNVNTTTETTKTVPISIPQTGIYVEAIRFNRASQYTKGTSLEFDLYTGGDEKLYGIYLSDNWIYYYNRYSSIDKIKNYNSIILKDIDQSDAYNGTINVDIWYTLLDLVDVNDGTQWTPHSIYYYTKRQYPSYTSTNYFLCSAYYYNGSEFVKCSTNDLP